MKLLLDLGNTRLKWALATQADMVAVGAIANEDLGPDDIGQYFSANLSTTLLEQTLSEVWVSSVGAAEVLKPILSWLHDETGLEANRVDVSNPVRGFQNHYESIDSLGVDRWVAALGARSLVPQGDLIIIDAGTAVTIDWLSQDNVFEGGVILPGAKLMHQSLLGGTVGIDAESSDVVQIIGKTTSECVNSGIGFGMGGAVERIVKEMTETIDRPTRLILTGGGANLIAEFTNLGAESEPDLVLHGLLYLSLINSPTP
ncbi:MAG: type III pantothenate kinase [Pseudomonadota bacterium]